MPVPAHQRLSQLTSAFHPSWIEDAPLTWEDTWKSDARMHDNMDMTEFIKDETSMNEAANLTLRLGRSWHSARLLHPLSRPRHPPPPQSSALVTQDAVSLCHISPRLGQEHEGQCNEDSGRRERFAVYA